MKKQKELWNIFFTMLKIGLFTFGGGYAMIALLENEFIGKKHWIEKDEFLDMVAIAESTPGPIAINAATYIGYKTFGIWGSLLATLAICIPSFVIIYAISLFFDLFLSLTLVAYAFRGIQVGVIYLIGSAGLRMLKNVKKKPLPLLILSVTLTGMLLCSIFAVNFSTIFYILISGTAGVVVYLLGTLKKAGKKEAQK